MIACNLNNTVIVILKYLFTNYKDNLHDIVDVS